MSILRLLKAGPAPKLKRAIRITCLTGLANAVLIGLVNHVAGEESVRGALPLRLVVLYGLALVIYYRANRESLVQANAYLQERLSDLRLSIIDLIRRSDLRALEMLDQGGMYASLARESGQLTQNLPLLVSAVQSASLLVFCVLYTAWLSPLSSLLIGGMIAGGMVYFWKRRNALDPALASVRDKEGAMLESLLHFTDGFQEVRLNADKNDAVFARYTEVVDELYTVTLGIGSRWVVLLQFSNAFLCVLLGLIVFVLPLYLQGSPAIVFKLTSTAIFCAQTVTAITAATPLYSRANVELQHLYALRERLSARLAPGRRVSETVAFRGFKRLRFEQISFSYRTQSGEASFTVGPWDLTVERDEVLFLLGGNGSGKSTTMKLLCGLYTPDSGRILVDDVAVDESNRHAYRELFSAIFSDFHLFDRLYGLEDADPDEATRLIDRMELGHKVRFADGGFSVTDLSTGERKRLALIVSLLEDREIYLFDEWAADQDVHFREVFYTRFLPEMKQRDKTVVAVTHDDRYWPTGDRRVTMELGSMVESAGSGVGA